MYVCVRVRARVRACVCVYVSIESILNIGMFGVNTVVNVLATNTMVLVYHTIAQTTNGKTGDGIGVGAA